MPLITPAEAAEITKRETEELLALEEFLNPYLREYVGVPLLVGLELRGRIQTFLLDRLRRAGWSAEYIPAQSQRDDPSLRIWATPKCTRCNDKGTIVEGRDEISCPRCTTSSYQFDH